MAQLGNTIINGNLVVTGTITGSIDATVDIAIKATKDGADRVISSSYGSSVIIAGNVLSLKAPDGQTLATAQIAAAVVAEKDAANRVFSSSYANQIAIANSILSLKSPDGQTLSTAQISTADTLQAITTNGASTDKAINITNTTPATNTTSGALKVAGGVGVAGDLYAAKVIGAYWNDYAEMREIKTFKDEVIEPGDVVVENGDETLSLSYMRMQAGAKIITDTYGMCIGENTLLTKPIALCGRVLVKTFEPRSMFKLHTGAAVCAGPNGTVSIMTRREIQEYPDRIIGYVVSVPDYEEWGIDKIKVNQRIWINIK